MKLNSNFTNILRLDLYKKEKHLGKGGYGKVDLMENIETKQKLARKKIFFDSSDEETSTKRIEQEINILKFVNHPTIVKLYGYKYQEKKIYIFMEYAKNESLQKYLYNNKTKKSFKNTERQKILIGIARGMKYLHDRCM